MAAQVKKNKNQFIRKGTASSTVINTLKDVNIVDVSAIQSGLERVQIDTPDVNSGVQSGVERVPVNTTNANSVEIIGDLRSIQKYAEVNLFSLSEQPATNLCTDVGGGSGMPEENFDPGGTMHAPVVYNQSSEYMPKSHLESHSKPAVYNQNFEYMPKLHLESHSKPSIGSNSQSAVRNYASCIFGENQSAENPRTTEDLLFAKGAAQRSRYSEPHGHTDGQHTDTYVNQLIHQQMLYQGNSPTPAGQHHMEYNPAPPLPKTPPPELPAKPPRMAKNKTWGQDSSPTENRRVNQKSPALKKHHSSRERKEASHQYSNNLDDDGEEDKDISWEYPGERNLLGYQMMTSDIQYPNFKEHSQMHYGGEGIRDDIEQGDQSSEASQMFGWQYREQTGRMPGRHPGKPMQQMRGVLYKGNMGNMHSSGRDSGYTPSWQEEYSGQWQDGHHSKGPSMHSMEYFGQLPTRHHAGTMGPVSNRHHAGTVGPVPNKHHTGTMGPVTNIHHTGTIGQMPYQLNEGSMQQMHGGSVGQMYGGFHGGSVEQMHPPAQSEVMYPSGQQYLGEFHPDDIGQSWDFPMETWQGDGQGKASYSQGASNFPGPSSYMTDRELASEKLDQRMNNPWFREMVQNMKELVEREGLVVKDVFPDGNCLFTAVVDQLRVLGNFSFTPSTLRAAAVAYLRENPKQHDGTHLEQFLLNESWDHYLGRICKDGEWGEHIILGAMSEVLKCRIIVLGGISGNLRTVVQPQHMSDEEEKKLQKEKEGTSGSKTVKDGSLRETANGSKTVKDGSMTETANSSKTVKDVSLTETAKSEVTGAESQPMQTGAASSTSKADVKTKGTDTSHSKDKTGSLSKQDKEKKDEELQIGEDLYIGLLGEMHYVSLRKKDWEERLNEKLKARIKKRKAKRRQEAGQENDSTSDDDLCLPEDPKSSLASDVYLDPRSGASLPHLDYLMQQIASSPYFLDKYQYIAPIIADYKKDSQIPHDGFECLVIGFWTEYLECLPLSYGSSRCGSFSKEFETPDKTWTKRTSLLNLRTYCKPYDSVVVSENQKKIQDTDLFIDTNNSSPGFMRLCPTKPHLWSSALKRDRGKLVLQHMRCMPGKDNKKSSLMIAFACAHSDEPNEWINRDIPSGWIHPTIRSLINNERCIVIPTPSSSFPHSEVEWKLSYELAEEKLIELVISRCKPLVQGYKYLKFILQCQLNECFEEHSEIFRHVFYNTCDHIQEKEWQDRPASCILTTLDTLLQYLEKRHVPHYFIKSINVAHHVHETVLYDLRRKVEIILHHPLFSLWYLLDKLDLMTVFSKTFDSAVEDANLFAVHKDLKRSKLEFFIPHWIQKIRHEVEMSCFEKAFDLCVSAFEEMSYFSDSFTFQDFVMSVLNELPLTERWCFSFFLDSVQGTCFLTEVTKGVDTVSLTISFGSEILLYLENICIPSQCIDFCHVLRFVDMFMAVLQRQKNYGAIIVGLKTFLSDHFDKQSGRYMFENDADEITDGVFRPRNKISSSHRFLVFKLVRLHEKLFEACLKSNQLTHFRNFLEPYERLCELSGLQLHLSFLKKLRKVMNI